MAKQPRHQQRELVRRPTTMAAAFGELAERMGLDVADVRVPMKREPSWRVTRRKK